MSDPFTYFLGGAAGPWRVTEILPICGETLPAVPALAIVSGAPRDGAAEQAAWVLRGFGSNVRYATREERDMLRQRQAPLGRAEATCAALIPMRKSARWWDLAQDERRRIFEEQSGHTRIGAGFLPQIARQLCHCRDLGEPFDFLTWFEFAPAEAPAFQRLCDDLRRTEEWSYVEREVEVRLVRG